MTTALRVHVNREDVRSVTPEATAIDADGPFEIELVNHGQPAHVHVYLDDALAAVADVSDGNWFLPAEQSRTVPIAVKSLEAVQGRLRVATGYGAQEAFVDVNVQAGAGGVKVDEELSKPQPTVTRPPEADGTATPTVSADAYYVPGLFVGVGVVAVAVVALFVRDAAAMTVGIGAIVVAVAVALYLLLSP